VAARLLRIARGPRHDTTPVGGLAFAIARRVALERLRARRAGPQTLGDRDATASPLGRPSLEDRLLHLSGDETWISPEDRIALAAVRAHGFRAAARALGIAGSTLRRRVRRIADADPATGTAAPHRRTEQPRP
jgi:hypothetical protein